MIIAKISEDVFMKDIETPQKLDDDTSRAFSTLGQMLKLAKIQKERKEREEALKEAGIDPSEVNLDQNFVDALDIDSNVLPKLMKKQIRSWIIYQDNKYKDKWDLIMTS